MITANKGGLVIETTTGPEEKAVIDRSFLLIIMSALQNPEFGEREREALVWLLMHMLDMTLSDHQMEKALKP